MSFNNLSVIKKGNYFFLLYKYFFIKDSFEKLKENLEILILSNNNLTTFDESFIFLLNKIKLIDLSNNPWQCDQLFFKGKFLIKML